MRITTTLLMQSAHLDRAARSAGEAFAFDEGAAPLSGPSGYRTLVSIAASVVIALAAAALLINLFAG